MEQNANLPMEWNNCRENILRQKLCAQRSFANAFLQVAIAFMG